MASIRKRGSKWQVRVIRKGYPEQTNTFPSKRDAEEWGRQIENEMDRGMFISRVEAEKNTLYDILERYKVEVTPSKRGASYELIRIEVFQRLPIAKLMMAAITPKVIAQYRDSRLKKVSGSSVNRELNVLSAVINHARREWEINIHQNPIELIRRPPHNQPRNRRLSEDEEARLMNAVEVEERDEFGRFKGAKNTWLKPVVILALETGMRRGELLSLCWENIDLRRRVAYLPMTKNGDNRGVPLSSRSLELLQQLPPADKGLVFPVSSMALRLSFERACKRAGLVNFHFHDLRHEAISRFFEKGLSLPEAATISGHKTWSMLRRYTHLSVESLAAKLD